MARLSIADIVTMSVEDLGLTLHHYFDADIPAMPADAKMYDWGAVQRQLVYCGNVHSTLCGMMMHVRREVRKHKKGTEAYEAIATKRDMLEEAKEAIKTKYDSMSRVFTIYDEERKRLK